MSSSSSSSPSTGEESGEPKKALIELRDLGVWYQLRGRRVLSIKHALLHGRVSAEARTLWALRHLDLRCHEGEVVGIVGRNGAGKSTLCLILARILTPDEGEAIVRGTTTPLLTLGSGFHPELSGRENVYVYSAFLGTSRRRVDERFDEIVAFSELDSFIDEPLYTYSSGMRARLAFSVAAALDPEIMILDEVLGVGDREFRAKSRARILQMMKQSKLIVIVSHSIGFLRRVCTHCLWLDKGRPIAYGEAGGVLDRYESSSGGHAVEEEEGED